MGFLQDLFGGSSSSSLKGSDNSSSSSSLSKRHFGEVFAKGTSYIGELNTSGQKDGRGVLNFLRPSPITSSSSTPLPMKYEGQFCEDLFHGHGCLSLSNGDRIEGIWARGEQIGPLKLFHASGERYEGSVDGRGRRHGQGRYSFKDGSVYEGNWCADRREGEGKFFYPNSDRFEGQWEADVKCGHGVYYFHASGRRYDGEWKDDKRHGRGKLYQKDGLGYLECEWMDDKQVSKAPPTPPALAHYSSLSTTHAAAAAEGTEAATYSLVDETDSTNAINPATTFMVYLSPADKKNRNPAYSKADLVDDSVRFVTASGVVLQGRLTGLNKVDLHKMLENQLAQLDSEQLSQKDDMAKKEHEIERKLKALCEETESVAASAHALLTTPQPSHRLRSSKSSSSDGNNLHVTDTGDFHQITQQQLVERERDQLQEDMEWAQLNPALIPAAATAAGPSSSTSANTLAVPKTSITPSRSLMLTPDRNFLSPADSLCSPFSQRNLMLSVEKEDNEARHVPLSLTSPEFQQRYEQLKQNFHSDLDEEDKVLFQALLNAVAAKNSVVVDAIAMGNPVEKKKGKLAAPPPRSNSLKKQQTVGASNSRKKQLNATQPMKKPAVPKQTVRPAATSQQFSSAPALRAKNQRPSTATTASAQQVPILSTMASARARSPSSGRQTLEDQESSVLSHTFVSGSKKVSSAYADLNSASSSSSISSFTSGSRKKKFAGSSRPMSADASVASASSYASSSMRVGSKKKKALNFASSGDSIATTISATSSSSRSANHSNSRTVQFDLVHTVEGEEENGEVDDDPFIEHLPESLFDSAKVYAMAEEKLPIANNKENIDPSTTNRMRGNSGSMKKKQASLRDGLVPVLSVTTQPLKFNSMTLSSNVKLAQMTLVNATTKQFAGMANKNASAKHARGQSYADLHQRQTAISAGVNDQLFRGRV